MLDTKFWNTIKYFKYTEFDSPDEPGSGLKMDYDFINLIDLIRYWSNVEFHVQSGFRTSERNLEIKGSLNSAHLRGLAADIFAQNNKIKHIILKSCFLFCIPRIGIYEKHIHIDVDLNLPHPIVWYGKY